MVGVIMNVEVASSSSSSSAVDVETGMSDVIVGSSAVVSGGVMESDSEAVGSLGDTVRTGVEFVGILLSCCLLAIS